jgi:Flp pilus assembly protein CpaB
MSPGAVVDNESFREVSVPKQFVPASWVSADDMPRLAGKVIEAPLVAGEALAYADITTGPSADHIRRCRGTIGPGVAEAGSAAARDAAAALPRGPTPTVGPAPPIPPGDTVEVVVARRDLEEGATLTAADLESARLPASLVTASVVLPPDRDSLVGAHLASPVEAHDWFLWQDLMRTGGAATLASCMASIGGVRTQAEKARATALATAAIAAYTGH